MTVQPLDTRSALIVVDLQAGTLGQALAHPAATVVANAVALIADFRERGLPVVFASVDGTPPGRNGYGAGGREFPAAFAELAPELGAAASDILPLRRSWSAFAGTDLQERLAAAEITEVVIIGLATTFGVESTARAAYDLGYTVAIAIDAISDPQLAGHEASVARVFPVLGETGTTAEVIAALP